MSKLCKCKSINMVREWNQAFGINTPEEPSIDDEQINDLCVELIAEENRELDEALKAKDKKGVLDALTDLQYVLDGAFLRLGFANVKDAAFREVHRSNMSKLGEDGLPILREDGKILKGSNYSPPNLDQYVNVEERKETN